MDDDTEILKVAQSHYQTDKAHWEETYRKAKEDLFFLSDDPMAQWDRADHKARTGTGRPALTIDMMGQFIHQVVNDVKMNTPTINVIPGRGETTVDDAEIFKGLIRNIEYSSNADDVYDNGVNYSVKCSIGYIRVDHDYVDDESFDQELKLKRVINPLAVFLDADSVEPDGSDATRVTIVEEMRVSKFKAKYPGKEPACFDNIEGREKEINEDEMIVIAEQFIIKEEDQTIAIGHDGKLTEYSKGGDFANTRSVKRKKIIRRKMSGKDVLEETTFPGKYIPLIPVYGEESWVDGNRHLFSLIRKSKGAQQMYNYWKSLETELIMKQPQSPVMAQAGQTEEYADDWQNPTKSMVLRYRGTDDDGNPLPAPQRLDPPSIPAGVVNASRETVDDIKATMGIYNASLGAKSNETSGVAINQRKLEGDVATYHFGDNLVKSITHVGRVLVSAIPEIYDTERVLRIIGEEDEPKNIGVNGALSEDQEETIDLSKGSYDVKVIAGSSFTTRRQETVAAMTELFNSNPELFMIMGDVYFKNSDFTGAQAMAKRMEKAIDPKFLEEEDEGSPEQAQMQAMQQEFEQIIQGMQGELQQAQQQLADKQGELQVKAQGEQTKAESAQAQNQIKSMELNIKEKEMQLDEAKANAEFELKRRELDIKEIEINGKLELESAKFAAENNLDRDKLDVEHEKIHLDTLTTHRGLDLEEEALERQPQELGETNELGNSASENGETEYE